jgi:hypothetical protein
VKNIFQSALSRRNGKKKEIQPFAMEEWHVNFHGFRIIPKKKVQTTKLKIKMMISILNK